jgi:Flp pilus assembly protein TadG
MLAVSRWGKALVRHAAREEGSGLLETALASTVFLAMLLGIFQMSLASYTLHYISDAAREGSRYAMVRGSTSCTNTPNLSNCNVTSDQVQTYVRSLAYPGIQSSRLTVTTTWMSASSTQPTTWSSCTTGTCNAPGNQVKVVAAYTFPLSVPFVPALSFSLTSTSKMVISQ